MLQQTVISEYPATEKRFQQKLMAAIHIVSLPGRGFEIGSVGFANRHIFCS
jgi:hypothetical protein